MMQVVVDALIEVPGLRVSVQHDLINYLVPTALIEFTPEWNGPSRDEVMEAMAKGDPAIHLHQLGDPDEFGVDPINLDEGEVEVVIRRLAARGVAEAYWQVGGTARATTRVAPTAGMPGLSSQHWPLPVATDISNHKNVVGVGQQGRV